jgi:hypothetical protein
MNLEIIQLHEHTLRQSNAELLAALKKATYYLDEIRAGNSYSEDALWKFVLELRGLIIRTENH